MSLTSSEQNADHLLNIISNALLEKKAERLIQLDVHKISSIADFFLICHVDTDIQIKALANNVIKSTDEQLNEKPIRKEGLDACHWVVLDYGNVMVHIFRTDARSFYQIEKMWSDAPSKEITD